MRVLIAILAWGVMGLSLLFTLYSTVGTYAALHMRGAADGTIAAVLINSLFNAFMRLVESFTLGIGLLYLLDVDKRVRLGAAVKEAF